MNLCIIPARSGSKRIPNKNIKLFHGKPIIEYAICSAEKSKLFDKIIISTDNDITFNRYLKYIPFLRSEKASNDKATLTDVIFDVIEKMNVNYANIFVILPTAVFVDEHDILLSYDLLKNNDSVVSVLKFNSHIQRAFILKNNKIKMLNEKYMFSKSQDLHDTYYDAGQLYWFKKVKFIKQKRIFMKNTVPYILKDAIDINTISDWKKAEELYAKSRKLLVQ